MKEMIDIILCIILVLITIILIGIVMAAVVTGGVGFIVLFGDVIVCIFILIWMFKKLLRKKR